MCKSFSEKQNDRPTLSSKTVGLEANRGWETVPINRSYGNRSFIESNHFPPLENRFAVLSFDNESIPVETMTRHEKFEFLIPCATESNKDLSTFQRKTAKPETTH